MITMRQTRALARLASLLPSAALLGTLSPHAAAQSADPSFLESVQLHAEAGGDLVVGGDPGSRFDPGGHLRGHLSLPLAGQLRAQLGTGSWWFPANEGATGRLISAELGLRFTPMAERLPEGLVLDANAGLGLTGDLQRPVFSVGVGWDFLLGDAASLGPVLRYTHLLQPDSEAQPDDARLLGLGIRLNVGIPVTVSVSATRSDRDQDGVDDDRDQCPGEAEDMDGFRDDDGCPDPDNDGDGIQDQDDRCPDGAETRNGFEDDDGCPDTPPSAAPTPPTEPQADTTAQGTRLDQTVHFNYRSHGILGSEEAAIQAVCDQLKERPGLRVRVHGHADEAGSAGYNHELSAKRAGNVAKWLVRCGVDGERIVVQAEGENMPVCRESSEECAHKNRRVEFETLE